MKLKRITSLCLTWSFIILMFSSLVLYVLPSGKVAHWANWSFLGLGKEQWAALHTNSGYLFLLACAFHIYFNLSHILNYLKNRKRELTGLNLNSVVAFGVVLVLAVLTIAGVPPVSWIQDLNSQFKARAEVKFGIPPYGHAELSSLDEFSRRTGLDVDEIVNKLKTAGFEGIDASARILDLAEKNKVSPQALFNSIGIAGKKGRAGKSSGSSDCESEAVESESGHGSELHAAPQGSGGGSGYGQQSLKTVCKELDLDASDVLKQLETMGYKGKTSDTLKSIAETKGERPSEIVHLLRELAAIPHE